MFCDGCGSPMQPGQQFCGSCGKRAGVPPATPTTGERVARHIQLLAIFWLAASAINLMGAAVLFVIGNTLFSHLTRFPEAWPAQSFLQGLFTSLAAFLLIKAALGFTAGWGLLRRESWARLLTIVLGCVSLIHVPLGTALGIYTLWVLLPSQSEEEYRRFAQSA